MEENVYNGQPLSLNASGQNLLLSAAKWAKFIAIMTFVSAAIMVVLALTASLWFGTLRNAPGAEMAGFLAMGSGVFTAIYLFVGLIHFFFAFFLYRFASRALHAVARDGAALNECIASLGTYFRLQGILIIIALAFVALTLVVGIVGGIAAGVMAM